MGSTSRRRVIGVGAIGLCAFVAVVSWLVHTQGEVHRREVGPGRQEVLRTRLVAPDAGDPIRPSLGTRRHPSGVIGEAPLPSPPRPRPARTRHLAPVRPTEAPKPPPLWAAAPPEAPPPSPGPTKTAEATRAAPPEPPAGPPPPPWLSAQRVSALSVAEQEALGRKIHELLVQRHPEVAGGASPELAPLRRQVESVLTALRGSHPPAVAGPDPRLFLLQTAELRSFSHPGASVYVSLALLDFAPDPAELEFVLARELSHLDRRHAAARIDAARGANAGEVDLVSEAYKQLVAGYTPEQEFEADVDAYRLLRSRGRTHRQTVSHLRRLVQREASKASEARPGAPSATARLARLDAMLDQ